VELVGDLVLAMVLVGVGVAQDIIEMVVPVVPVLQDIA
jgi:hypothetical protein